MPNTHAVWDTAGQERFHSMSKHYYRRAAGALMVYDITDLASFHRVKWWVDSMLDAVVSDTSNAEPPVLILGTKSWPEAQVLLLIDCVSRVPCVPCVCAVCVPCVV
jgi:signal recognition particle receptor subunit beta